MSTSDTPLERLRYFCSQLDYGERKALITLARSQSIPEPDTSPILFSKVQPILDRLVLEPPYVNLAQPLYPEGQTVLDFLSSPLTTGLLLVYALGVSLSDADVQHGKETSFTKELLATQTPRSPSAWNWLPMFYHAPLHSNEILHPLFPQRSRLHNVFASGVQALSQSYRHRIILPHYSKRGISSETSDLLLSRVHSSRISKGLAGPRYTFHRKLNRRNVTSRDIVHHYVRTGDWVGGRTEMKQKWYPSGLLPRTYFSWGGTAIALSCYLRNFFNDLGDCFPSTQRHNRVQPDWLQHPTRTGEGGFVFYDLTSFTSWFHEHASFLLACSERFRGIPVYLTGYDLTVSSHDLGDLVLAYLEGVNNFPTFIVNGSHFGLSSEEDVEFRHLCAGFLGVPGNLITCTLPHALAQATLFDHSSELQVPGDDVGAAFRNDDHRRDIGYCAQTLGVLQFDKVYSTSFGLCIYLKRLVIDLSLSITLAPMLIYPLLPYLINPEGSYTSNQFQLPKPKESRSRAARVLVAFQRDIWNMTGGIMDPQTEEILSIFIVKVHQMVGLPLGAIFQGRLYGHDGEEDENPYPDITVKFDASDTGFLKRNPDLDFAGKYVTRMTIRATAEVPITPPFRSLSEGETIIVRRSKSWNFLEDMGYVRVVGIPGEKVELIGSDARDAYLFASEPPLREVEILCDIDTHQLVASGVLRDAEGEVFDASDLSGSRHVDLNTMSWRYRKYVDLDDPKGSSLYGSTRRWCVEKLSQTRESLSPEPGNPFLEY